MKIVATAAGVGPIPPTPPREEFEEGLSLSTVLGEMRDDVRY